MPLFGRHPESQGKYIAKKNPECPLIPLIPQQRTLDTVLAWAKSAAGGIEKRSKVR
jgi:hypothetical protein